VKNWFRTFASVFAAFVGVQSDQNRIRDFQEGRFSAFVVAGLMLTVIFLLSVYGFVQLVMWSID
jgi:hypothetical protein